MEMHLSDEYDFSLSMEIYRSIDRKCGCILMRKQVLSALADLMVNLKGVQSKLL